MTSLPNKYLLSDDQLYKFVGNEINEIPAVKEFFSTNTVNYISSKITLMTKGVDEKGRDIILPDDKIMHLMNTVYLSYNPKQGFDQNWTPDEYLNSLIGQTISNAVFDIKTVLEYEQCTAKYTVWDTVLGEYNPRGLRSFAPIKLKEKRPNSMEFNMKY